MPSWLPPGAAPLRVDPVPIGPAPGPSAKGTDAAPALSAPDRQPLHFAGVRGLVGQTLNSLNAMGIGRNDRVAIVRANGPEMAACYIANRGLVST